jgi:hypothetical protein
LKKGSEDRPDRLHVGCIEDPGVKSVTEPEVGAKVKRDEDESDRVLNIHLSRTV